MTARNSLHNAIKGALLIGGMSVAATALAAPQGLYSAEELGDADVVTKANPGQSIGDVEDILLDDNMQMRGLVIETGDLLDLGGKQYVIEPGDFTVETRHGDSLDRVSYVVHVALDGEALSQQPEYTDTWWAQTKDATREAWADTQEGASSAWETTKAATAEALTRAGNALEEAGENAQQAVDQNQ